LPEKSPPLLIQRFTGPRSQIRVFFELADDSPSEIDGYIEAGEVLVARRGDVVVGHVQFIPSGVHWEIKSVAVSEQFQGQGIGTALIRSVLQRAALEGCIEVAAGTATADIGTLRFYQRLGFRMDRIEHDVFTTERGYAPIEVNGIPVRDRVWFSKIVTSERQPSPRRRRLALIPLAPTDHSQFRSGNIRQHGQHFD